MKKINIPIHSHTKVRRKRSVWVIDGLYDFCGYSCNGQDTPLITDLQRVPKVKIYPVPEGYDVVPLSYGGFTFKKKLGIFQNIWNKIRRKI